MEKKKHWVLRRTNLSLHVKLSFLERCDWNVKCKCLFIILYQRMIMSTRRGFRLSQRLHLRTLKNFVSEKSGKAVKNRGNVVKNRENVVKNRENVVKNRENIVKNRLTLDKIGKPANFEEVYFFSCICACQQLIYKKRMIKSWKNC